MDKFKRPKLSRRAHNFLSPCPVSHTLTLILIQGAIQVHHRFLQDLPYFTLTIGSRWMILQACHVPRRDFSAHFFSFWTSHISSNFAAHTERYRTLLHSHRFIVPLLTHFSDFRDLFDFSDFPHTYHFSDFSYTSYSSSISHLPSFVSFPNTQLGSI